MITSAKEATQISVEFLEAYYPHRRPLSAQRGNGVWVVKVDVGAFYVRTATLEIDADSGEIMSYELPQ